MQPTAGMPQLRAGAHAEVISHGCADAVSMEGLRSENPIPIQVHTLRSLMADFRLLCRAAWAKMHVQGRMTALQR